MVMQFLNKINVKCYNKVGSIYEVSACFTGHYMCFKISPPAAFFSITRKTNMCNFNEDVKVVANKDF